MIGTFVYNDLTSKLAITFFSMFMFLIPKIGSPMCARLMVPGYEVRCYVITLASLWW